MTRNTSTPRNQFQGLLIDRQARTVLVGDTCQVEARLIRYRCIRSVDGR